MSLTFSDAELGELHYDERRGQWHGQTELGNVPDVELLLTPPAEVGRDLAQEGAALGLFRETLARVQDGEEERRREVAGTLLGQVQPAPDLSAEALAERLTPVILSLHADGRALLAYSAPGLFGGRLVLTSLGVLGEVLEAGLGG